MFSIGARSRSNPNPTHRHMWFSPIIPRTAEAVFEANKVFAEAAKEFSLPLLRFSLPACYWERKDLQPETIQLAVRKGLYVMPFFRKTELSDAELSAIVSYLTRNKP